MESFDFSALLQNHEKKHKMKPTQFVSVAGGVRQRLENTIKCRRSSRLTIFDRIRNLSVTDSPKKQPNPVSKVEHRRMQLEKWKEEKEKKKQLAAAQKKKPFVAGVTHHPLKFIPPPPPPKVKPSTSGRVTRSQTAKHKPTILKPEKFTTKQTNTQSFAPRNAVFKAPEIKNMTKVPVLAPPSKVKKNVDKITFQPVQNPTKKANSKTYVATQPKSSKTNVTRKPVKETEKRCTRQTVIIPKSESTSEEKLRSPKSPVEVPLTPEQIAAEEAKINSPFVTHARGKANARREIMKKIDEGLLDDDASDVDSVCHFRHQLDSEIKRMTEMCEKWEKISEQIMLPETVQELVLGAVGQARLLMSHKLQQFASLVQRCECPEPGRALVTPADLHGFWDMVFMQVEDVDKRFQKLDELRARNWSEEVAAAPRRAAAARAKPPARPAAPAVPAAARPAASRLRDVIAAARRAKKREDHELPVDTDHKSCTEADPMATARTFEAGFFCVRSPVKTDATPTRTARPSLLQSVLSSEAKKSASKDSASLAMLRASLIGKDVENDSPVGESPVQVIPINLHATPSRSILKPVNVASSKKSGKKSIKVVLFDHSASNTHNTSHNEDCSTIEGGEMLALEYANKGSGAPSKDIEKDRKQKENKQSRRKSLVRQDATEECSPIMTRSRRKSMQTLALTEDVVEKTALEQS